MWKPGRRSLLVVACVVALLLAAGLVLRGRQGRTRFLTAVVDRGTIIESVGATGTLQAVTTVQVGSQVSGIIQSLDADFNSVVRKGQVIARLDPSLLEARASQARANLVAARANAERAAAQVEDARQKHARARELFEQRLLPASELETAKANHDASTAQVKASEAAVTQAEASLNQAEVDLQHTVISAPIAGVVIARNVDVGQTVAASFQAPTLFVIANDLSRMQVNASVDEADIGRVRTGQQVTFRVDAHPERTFAGRLEQVRLQPVTVQNVVTYNTIVSVENPRQLLMPGMTATVTIIVNQSENALRLPAAALRFRPEGAPGAAQGARRERRRAAPEGSASPREGRGEQDHGPIRGRQAEVYLLGPAGAPEARPVILGVSDGQFTEVRSGLDEGAVVITGTDGATSGPASGSARSSSGANPFAPQRPERRQR